MIIESTWWLRGLIAIFLVLMTEFVIKTIVYIKLRKDYPNQKYKTIRKKLRNRTFLDKYITFDCFNYDRKKYKICVVLYLYRVIEILLLIGFLFMEMPNQLTGIVFFIWEVMLVIPCGIWLKLKINKQK